MAQISDVPKLVKLCIHQMQILTFIICWMRMRIEAFITSVKM